MISLSSRSRGSHAGRDSIVAFDDFTLDLKARTLSQNGQRLHIRQRELDILICLARRPNRFVSKTELIEIVWLGQPVSDANVRVQISALRRVLGEGPDRPGFIDFFPRQGYRFCPSGHRAGAEAPPAPEEPYQPFLLDAATRRHNLPVRVKRSFGREYDCGRLVTLLADNRLATIVGPGGIGKTTLALTVAERLVDTFDNGVRFVDLAGLSDVDLVAGTLAATIGVVLGPDATQDALIAALASLHILFVVDNCEHLIGPAAALVESILTQTRHVRFLCTSREPLRSDGECLLRLGPLELPPPTGGLAPEQVAEYPAVQLFNDRAGLSTGDFRPEGQQILTVASLCHRLDGNPLAIELAAARLGLFGLDGLVAQLDESLGLLIQGRRTAVPRHKTLRETIDWSYNLLPPAERRLLERLSVFRGGFSLEAARAVAGRDTSDDDLLHDLAELVAKSLVNVDSTSGAPEYRMLLLTREFAFEKLAGSGGYDAVAEGHARYFLDLMMAAWRGIGTGAEAWVADIGAAIDWGLGEPGNPELASTLIRASFSVMERFSRLPDRGRMIDRALARIGDGPDTDTVGKLGLYIQRLMNMQFTSADEGELTRWAAITDALGERVYLRTGDITARIETLATRCGMAFSLCDGPELLRLAEDGERAASAPGAPMPRPVRFERWLFQAHHFCGHHDAAQAFVSRVLAYPEDLLTKRFLFTADHISTAVTARIFQARTLWITGQPQRASEIAAEALARSLAYAPNVTCYVLSFATIPVALWRGDEPAARHAIAQLETTAADQGLGYWSSWGRIYAFVRDAHADAGDDAVALPPLLIRNAFHADHLATLCTFRNPQALQRVEEGRVGWNTPEVLRRKAERDLAAGAAIGEAEALLVRALDLAHRQGAAGWALRAALSLGKIWQAQGRSGDALSALHTALAPFDTTLADSDIVAAQTLVSELELV